MCALWWVASLIGTKESAQLFPENNTESSQETIIKSYPLSRITLGLESINYDRG